MKRILIIGGCGYVGSVLYLQLVKSQYRVDTVDIEWFGNYVNKKNIKKNYKDLTPRFLQKYDVIILLAGHSSVQMCVENMLPAFRNNVENFLLLLKKLKNQIFIYASSSSVYGNTGKNDITEDYDRYTPENFYDLNKKEIDYYAHLSQVRYYGLRFGTVNGFSPNLRVDVMINKMYNSVKTKKRIVVVNPGIYRPILGMNDLSRAVERIIEKKAPRGIYNLASFNLTIKDIAIRTAKTLGNVRVDIKATPRSAYNFSINTNKFQKVFNFEFKDTPETITQSLIDNDGKFHVSTRDIKII